MPGSRSLRGKVVVVTGASSGIGRATAVAFAAAGCNVVVAARRAEALDETARLCLQAGGSALAVVTDVTSEDAVKRLTAAALHHWGRVDVWVNNAGVTLFALIADAPFDEHRRVFETNVFGAMFGARCAIPLFKAQGHGTLINVGSVLSEVGQPFVPSYVVSKFALRGLSEALRTEVAEYRDVHVCTILPFTVDTQHFQSGANEVGRHARALPPLQSPEKVARAIVDLAVHPRREVHVPHVVALGVALHWALPATAERLLRRALVRWHFDEVAQAPTEGNLYAPPGEPARTHGDRPPQLSTAAFLLWTTRELARMSVEELAWRARHLTARRESP